jgi:hypothetical protein
MHRKKIILFLSFIIISAAGFCRSNIYPSGGKATGMGNALVSQFDVYSAFNNQAGLAKVDAFSAGVCYENRFLLKEMSLRGGLVVLPTTTGTFALHFSAFGPVKWMESRVSLAYAKQLSKQLSVGLQFNYFNTVFPEDNSSISSFGFELGAIYQVTKKTYLGIHLANPYSLSLKTYSYEEKIPWKIRAGGHSLLNEKFKLSYEVEKVENIDLKFKLGAEWEAVQNLFFRMGLNSGATKLYGGLGYTYKIIQTDIAFEYHQLLGVTPSISLIFNLK